MYNSPTARRVRGSGEVQDRGRSRRRRKLSPEDRVQSTSGIETRDLLLRAQGIGNAAGDGMGKLRGRNGGRSPRRAFGIAAPARARRRSSQRRNRESASGDRLRSHLRLGARQHHPRPQRPAQLLLLRVNPPTMNTGPSARTASSPAGSRAAMARRKSPRTLPLKGGTKYYVRLAFQNEPEFIRALLRRAEYDPRNSLPSTPRPRSKVSSASDITFFTAKFTGRNRTPRQSRPGVRRPLPHSNTSPKPNTSPATRFRSCTSTPAPGPSRSPSTARKRNRSSSTRPPPPSRRNLKRWPISDRAMSSVTGGPGRPPGLTSLLHRIHRPPTNFRTSNRCSTTQKARSGWKARGTPTSKRSRPATAKKNSTVHRGLPAPPRPSRRRVGKNRSKSN